MAKKRDTQPYCIDSFLTYKMWYIYNFMTEFNHYVKLFFYSAEAPTENHTENSTSKMQIS